MFTAILGPVASLAKTWIEGKQKKAQLKSQVELTKLEATKTKIEKDGNWDESAMKASDNSWKDEAWTLTFIFKKRLSRLDILWHVGFDSWLFWFKRYCQD